MLTLALLCFGAVLLALAVAEKAVRRLPLTPAVIYLAVGWAAGWLVPSLSPQALLEHAALATVCLELAVLLSLFTVGLRLRMAQRLSTWRPALLLAGPGMVVTVLLGAAAAAVLLQLPLPAALLLAAILAPTDPVLASEVQIRSDEDRDAVRLSLTAEGGLNDGTALPAVMLGLGLMGLHTLGPWGRDWWLHDLLWPIGGGALVGLVLGRLLGRLLLARVNRGDRIARDELLYVGAVTLAYGVARATHTSSFVVVFVVGAALLAPFQQAALAQDGQAISARLSAFGERVERLLEAASVLLVGVALHSIKPSAAALAYGFVLVLAVRPLSVMAVLRQHTVTRQQRRLLAWFGIRGIGTLFYLAFALEHGVAGSMAAEFTAAVLTAIALSVLLHGVSATPLMTAYQRRRRAGPQAPPSD